MNRNLTVGRRIRDLRNKFDWTQEDLAKRLSIPRPSVSQVESGRREITSSELINLSGIFEISIDELLSPETAEKEVVELKRGGKLPKFNRDMFKQVFLYILERCGARPNVGKTVLYKILYFCDFNYYELYEEPLTGAAYRKIDKGPAPCDFRKIVEEMQKDGQIKEVPTEYYGQPQIKYLPLVEPNLDKMTARQKEVIDRVIGGLSPLDAKKISDYSHEDVPWKATKEKEIIDYELVFYRTPPYSVRSYPEE